MAEKRYCLVSDNSGHNYVIPVNKQAEWEAFMEIPEDDERSWDVPDFAEIIGGNLTFTDPQT